MNQIFLKSLCLSLVLWGSGTGYLSAQNPDWPIVPNLNHFTTTGGGSASMPAGIPFPYFASNAAQDAYGNLEFYVVDEHIYDNNGILIGSTMPYPNGKDILILPDPNDCDARLVLTAYVDLLVGPSSGNYHWFLFATRVKKTGTTWTVQPNVFNHTITGNDNRFMSMVLSQPDGNGDRYWYVVTSGYATSFKISNTGINYVSSYTLGFIGGPTDAEISPSGDRLMWADAGNNFELYWITLNPGNGAFLTFGNRPLNVTGAYQAFGLEFVDNSNVLVSALKTSVGGLSSGVFQCTFGNPVATQVSSNASYAQSHLEKALDGKIYAASATGLWGIDPGTSVVASITETVSSDYFGSPFFPSNYYFALPKQLDYENYSMIFACCQPTVTITGNYAVPLTESQTWIKSSGTCTIASGSNVKLDADPLNGYVELNQGFFADGFQNLVFVAQAFNGCLPGAPLRPSDNSPEERALASPARVTSSGASIFPNPTNADFTLQFDEAFESDVLVTVMDLTGRTILQTNLLRGVSRQTFSLVNSPSGIYVVRAFNLGKPIWTGKVVKE